MSNAAPMVGALVSTHPVDRRERSRRGIVVKAGVMLSKVQIGGEILSFWNFELLHVTDP